MYLDLLSSQEEMDMNLCGSVAIFHSVIHGIVQAAHESNPVYAYSRWEGCLFRDLCNGALFRMALPLRMEDPLH